MQLKPWKDELVNCSHSAEHISTPIPYAIINMIREIYLPSVQISLKQPPVERA